MQQEAKILDLPPSNRVDAKKRIANAAIRCFNQYGPQRTSMADIAEEANISRKTLYRIFDDRATLIEYILLQRMYALGDQVREKLSHMSDYEEALLEGSIFAIRISKEDKLFNDIVKRDTNHRVEMFLLGPRDEVKEAISDVWKFVIQLGRDSGQIKQDISDERIVELLVNVHVILLIRDDYSDDDQRSFLRDFVLAALEPRTA